ncbi:MAG: transposase [Deltaproteobacteria bacterium]|nr:transposase [Deltaproteobacteria bacterium]
MSRPLRIEYPGAWHHVMNRGRRGEPVFTGRPDYAAFTSLLKEASELWNLRVAAYCLMPTHYHLLVQTPEANISRCMRHIDGVYTQRFNRLHQFDGPLFRGRYKSILLDADSYLLQLVRYIHRNPLRAELVDRLEAYKWSSHRGYLSRAKGWSWLHKAYVLSMLSARPRGRLEAYRNFMRLEDQATLLGVFNQKKWPSILGSEGFIGQIKERFFPGKTHDEVSQSRDLAPEPERIKQVVCAFYQVDENRLMVSKRGVFNEPRNMAIYLMRRLRGAGLNEIGKEFDMHKYSSVSSVIERMNVQISRDPDVRKRVDKLRNLLGKSQEKT